MYYKIENKECEVYKKLHKMRTAEIQIGIENAKLIEEKTGLKFKTFLGHAGQQNFRRTTQYLGFKFTEPDKVDLKIWQLDKQYPEIFVPNRRTKVGRDMAEFLANGLKGSNYKKPLDILGIPYQRKFTFPHVEIVGGLILIYLGKNGQPTDENVIEITKREFDALSCSKVDTNKTT